MTLLTIPSSGEKQGMALLNAGAESETERAESKPVISALPADEQNSGGQVLEFTGLDLRESAGGGAYLSCMNVSTKNYPCLSPRPGRAYKEEARFQGADDLFRFDGNTVFRKGTQLWFDDGENPAVSVGSVSDSPKTFAVVNTRLTIWPDAVSLDINTGKISPLGASFNVGNAVLSDGKILSGTFPSASVIESQPMSTNGDVQLMIPFYDSEEEARAGGQESHAYPGQIGDEDITGKWVVPSYDDATGYALRRGWLFSHRFHDLADPNTNGVVGRITHVGVEFDGAYNFVSVTVELYYGSSAAYTDVRAGDVVFLNGLLKPDGTEAGDIALRVWAANPTSLTFSADSLTGYSVNSEKIVRVERRIPALDYVCANDNRLWGVSNAVENTVSDDDGNAVKFNGRAIFCSKLGDPSNWFYYQGVSMDSWTAAVSSSGDFTGICAWSDDILCFKESELFRIVGSQPSNFTLYSFTVPGVERGCGGTISIIDEVVYYKNARGVYRYSGGSPTRVSERLLNLLDGAANAGTDGRFYFVSCGSGLFAYDTWHDAWTKYDSISDGRFVSDGGVTIMLFTDSDGRKLVSRIDDGPEDGVKWSAELHPDYGTGKGAFTGYALNFGYKYYKFVFLRGELFHHDPANAEPSVTVKARFGDSVWHTIGTHSGAGKFVLRMPVHRYREDRIQIALNGSGDCTLRDIRYVYSTGGEWVQSDKGAMG